jgi:ABC-type multidrug transport system fused ATPase/permease subunit
MSFYDVTPLGHILSFFAKHLFSIDEILPDTALQVLSFLPLVLGTTIITCIYVPWLWATLPLYLFGWFVTVVVCIYINEIFQKLESSNKSPMFAHLSTTLEGLFLIRLYHAEEKFDFFNRTLIDDDHKALYSLLIGFYHANYSSNAHVGIIGCNYFSFCVYGSTVLCNIQSSSQSNWSRNDECFAIAFVYPLVGKNVFNS